MTTGSLCFTEILKSWKSCSSKSEASQTADSTSASGVARPYFCRSRGSREPALTPMRMEVPWSFAAWAISFTWSSNFLMLPGFTRTAPQPASIAAKTYRGWKWMSAITGIWDFIAMIGSASASLSVGQATRTMSHPEAVSSAICCRVALMSQVLVVVIDCTEIGAPPPTSTSPTRILRVGLRGARTGGSSLTLGRPRLIGMLTDTNVPLAPRGPSGSEGHGPNDVRQCQQHAHADQHRDDAVRERQEARHVDRPRRGHAPHARPAAPGPLDERPGDVAAVERGQRDDVEGEERDVEGHEQAHQVHRAGGDPVLVGFHGGDLPREPPHPDDADDGGVAFLAGHQGLGNAPQLLRQVQDHPEGLGGHVDQERRHRRDGLPPELAGGGDPDVGQRLRDGDAVLEDRLPVGVVHGALQLHRDHRERHLLARARHDDVHGCRPPVTDQGGDVRPGGDLGAAPGEHPVTGL